MISSSNLNSKVKSNLNSNLNSKVKSKKIKSEIYTGEDCVFIGLNGEPQSRLRWKITFGTPTRYVLDNYIPIGQNVDLEEIVESINWIKTEWTKMLQIITTE